MTNILVVDHSPEHQNRYRELLDDSTFLPHSCLGGAEALRLLRDGASAFRAIVLLWELNGTPGTPEIFQELRRDKSAIPVIVVSGLLDWSRAARAKALGASDFLLKPLERHRLRAALQVVVKEEERSLLVAALQTRVIGNSPPIQQMLQEIARMIAQPKETILLLGENGTGKEVLARAIHDFTGASDEELAAIVDRQEPASIKTKQSSLEAVNMAAMPATLVESVLFGHEKGAFTDAKAQRIGAFENCGSNSLFLDEIGELDFPLQAKLLRVIEQRAFRRVGGNVDIPFEARLICATNRDLIKEQRAGRFREDLYFRIATHVVRLPPLRQRSDDIALLTDHFLAKHAPGRSIRLARESAMLLKDYPFPGNVRELENLVKHAVQHADGDEILPYHLPVAIMEQLQATEQEPSSEAGIRWPEALFAMPQKAAMTEVENQFNKIYLAKKLKEAGGNITRAAKAAELDPKTFRRKWEQAGLEPLSGGD